MRNVRLLPASYAHTRRRARKIDEEIANKQKKGTLYVLVAVTERLAEDVQSER